MHQSLLYSLLELGDGVSRNLAFAHESGGRLSYGEETITDNCLLELQRRFPSIIQTRAFTKAAESRNGADWEWHIIGRVNTLRMRVQAKRAYKNDRISVSHKVASTGDLQLDTLIRTSRNDKMRPVYCFYCTENQRKHWQRQKPGNRKLSEYGCLLANARAVKKVNPRSLQAIEQCCVPWHYLAVNANIRTAFWPQFELSALSRVRDQTLLYFAIRHEEFPFVEAEPADHDNKRFPTFDDLNNGIDIQNDELMEGVVRTNPDLQIDEYTESFRESGSPKLIIFDIREFGEVASRMQELRP